MQHPKLFHVHFVLPGEGPGKTQTRHPYPLLAESLEKAQAMVMERLANNTKPLGPPGYVFSGITEEVVPFFDTWLEELPEASTSTELHTSEIVAPISPSSLDTLLAVRWGVGVEFNMTATDYADIRMFGRDILDVVDGNHRDRIFAFYKGFPIKVPVGYKAEGPTLLDVEGRVVAQMKVTRF